MFLKALSKYGFKNSIFLVLLRENKKLKQEILNEKAHSKLMESEYLESSAYKNHVIKTQEKLIKQLKNELKRKIDESTKETPRDFQTYR